jgi:hypothetical protein
MQQQSRDDTVCKAYVTFTSLFFLSSISIVKLNVVLLRATIRDDFISVSPRD